MTGRRLKGLAALTAVAVFLVQWVRVGTHYPEATDFDLHWLLGHHLRVGDPLYADGLDLPYPPFWGAAHAPLTVVPGRAAIVLVYPLVAVALVGLLGVLNRLTARHLPLGPGRAFWPAAVAVLLTSRYLLRDTHECGVNLALVALSWVGVYCWAREKDAAGGLCLGLATALKCTPALFLVYFAWKRQWRLAGIGAGTALLLTLAPAGWMGPDAFSAAMTTWAGNAARGLSEADPSVGVLGPEPCQNLSLRPALARFLMHLPAGHPGRVDEPVAVDFLDMPVGPAGLAVKAVLLVLVLGLAWASRRSVARRDDPRVLWECAGVSLVILLLSPITWGQHCVGVLPALYLLVRWPLAGRRLPAGATVALVAYALGVLALNRGVIGKDLTLWLNGLHLQTWTILGLLGAVVALHAREGPP